MKFIKENKLIQELLFYLSVLFIGGFYVLMVLTDKKLFLIGSIIGLIGLIYYFILNPIELKKMFANKDTKKMSYFLLKTFLLLFILIFLFSALNGVLPKIDLTSTKIFTLSAKTKAILKKIDKPLYIKFFVSMSNKSDDAELVRNLLKAYTKFNKNISYEEIDPNLEPAIARKYNITSSSSIILIYGSKKKELMPWDFYEIKAAPDQNMRKFIGEKVLTSAIEYLLTKEGKKIYFTIGHKEKYINDYQQGGYSSLKQVLENQNRQLINLNLLEKGKVPDDCSLLVIAAPEMDFTEPEIKMIDDYINKGGRFILITDVLVKSNIYKHIADKYGIWFEKGVVVDDKNFYAQLSKASPVIEINYHKITESIQQYNLPLVVLAAKPMMAKLIPDEKKGYKIISLAETKPTAWNEIFDPKKIEKQEQTPIKFEKSKGEIKGRKQIALLVEKYKEKKNTASDIKEEKNAIGVFFADSDMFSNIILKIVPGNLKLFENTVNFLINDEVLIDIPGKIIPSDKVVITSKIEKTLKWSSYLIIPVLLLILFYFIFNLKQRLVKIEINNKEE